MSQPDSVGIKWFRLPMSGRIEWATSEWPKTADEIGEAAAELAAIAEYVRANETDTWSNVDGDRS